MAGSVLWRGEIPDDQEERQGYRRSLAEEKLLERDSGGAPRRSPALCLGGDGETGPNLRQSRERLGRLRHEWLVFSYPGYSETLCGFADPRINSNDNVPNPNVTVLEWLKNRPSFQGDIAAFGAWDVIAAVFNPERSKLTVNAGYDPFIAIPDTPRLELLNHLKAETPRVWDDEPFDAIPFYTAVEYLKAKKPRVLYLSLGETDDWAHAGKYTEYLDSAHRVDSYLRALWELVQSMPEYRGNTTLIFSPDHGRGKAALINGATMARKSPIPSTSGWLFLVRTRPHSASVPGLHLSRKIRLPPLWRPFWGKITRRLSPRRERQSAMYSDTECWSLSASADIPV